MPQFVVELPACNSRCMIQTHRFTGSSILACDHTRGNKSPTTSQAQPCRHPNVQLPTIQSATQPRPHTPSLSELTSSLSTRAPYLWTTNGKGSNTHVVAQAAASHHNSAHSKTPPAVTAALATLGDQAVATRQLPHAVNIWGPLREQCGVLHHQLGPQMRGNAATAHCTVLGYPHQHVPLAWMYGQRLHPMQYTQPTGRTRSCKVRPHCTVAWQPTNTAEHHNTAALLPPPVHY